MCVSLWVWWWGGGLSLSKAAHDCTDKPGNEYGKKKSLGCKVPNSTKTREGTWQQYTNNF